MDGSSCRFKQINPVFFALWKKYSYAPVVF